MLENHSHKKKTKSDRSQLHFTTERIQTSSNSNYFLTHNNDPIVHISLIDLINEKTLINSFDCENDSTLGAGEYSFLIYGGQCLTLYNVNGPLRKFSWNTSVDDVIKQIRWSSYYRSYLIMTARLFKILEFRSNELIPIKKSFSSNEYLQLFTCCDRNLWLVYIIHRKKQQRFIHYNLSEWERKSSIEENISLDQLGLHSTDTICAIEIDLHGEHLALLVAEQNQDVTVGAQRRRRLILLTMTNMSPMKIIYFSGVDDLYWILTPVSYRRSSKAGWLLGKYFNSELTFIDDRLTCVNYKKELRNAAVTSDAHYLVLRTYNSLDIYEIG